MAKIWIVEDDEKIGLLIEMTVRKLGHDTLRLTDAEALEKTLRSGRALPDLMLLYQLLLTVKNSQTSIVKPLCVL